ncbi:MAG TPA: PLP-dependent aminotransferase family protein, partial [Nocardioides sp.]
QHPLGPAMGGAERLALLAAARAAGAVVAEDDYDSEFRYDVAPIPALASLDRDRVAYLGTASKTVAPSLRLGWLVVPPALTEPLDAFRHVTHDTAAWPVQRAFLALLRDGYVDRTVRAARRVYADRAARVADALPGIGPVAGMYATLELPSAETRAAHAALRAAGFDLTLLADVCRTHVRTGIVLGFGGCTDAELDAALAAVRSVL